MTMTAFDTWRREMDRRREIAPGLFDLLDQIKREGLDLTNRTPTLRRCSGCTMRRRRTSTRSDGGDDRRKV